MRQPNTRPFEPGDRIIYEGEYIGVLVAKGDRGWTVAWEDRAETGDHAFAEDKMLYANGGPESGADEAWSELVAASLEWGAATARMDAALKAYAASKGKES